AVLKEITTGEKVIVAGERKQYGESMTREVEKIIGLTYEQACVASIIQQGELQAIINYDPKRLKELINDMVGLGKLDAAYNGMGEVISGFRSRLRAKFGYDDTEIGQLEIDKTAYDMQLKEAFGKLNTVES